jgi:hypothetical protein
VMVFVTELRVVTCFCVIKQIVYTVVVNKKFTKDEDGNIIPLFLDIRIAFSNYPQLGDKHHHIRDQYFNIFLGR